ncbi:intradiol ring-cleavage dioxygenase [Ruegeria sp. MALMAid1280]|uniref:intradiol ring-cleavage dioxygenase n=1 Tax=Ruegeria sp. MALMAid1280 TaxID=3411634 RepID=UPI003BA3C75D
MSYFTEENSEAAVINRLGDDVDPRFRQIMESAVKHLHGFVKEVEPTMDEWFQAIQFLTATGKMCDDKRQEWILASDTLGVSMLVDAINHRRPDGATENTVLGPFHVSGAPVRALGENICLDGKGAPCVVSGTVTDENGAPIAGAKVDVWQTNDEGFYDVQQPGVQPDMNMRGLFTTDESGHYHYTTVKPLPYSIPTDGPVGELLVAMGRHAMRPAHIHYIVSAPGYETLVTHIFPKGDPYLDSDAVFGVKESLIVDFVDEGGSTSARFDVKLKKVG